MKITHFTVFGERCSGTNHAAAWIQQNLGLAYRMDFGWKHGPMELPKLKKAQATLCVLVVRNLPDWLRSLHLKPHHLSAKMRGLPFPQFIQCRVHSILDHTMGVLPGEAAFGTLMATEQHQGKPFANLIRMRRHKHRLWLKQLAQLPTTVVLQHERLTTKPELALQQVLALCNLPAREGAVPVMSYKGQEQAGDFKPKRYAAIDAASIAFILEQVDWEIEDQLGYDTRADLEGARAGDYSASIDLLRQSLTDRPQALALVDKLQAQLALQQDQLRHAEFLTQGQRKYLISLFHAIERSQSQTLAGRWKRLWERKPEG